MANPHCGECGSKMVLRKSKYGLFYGCIKYPECKGTHGAHQNSGKPLGIPADEETKEWRVKAHAEFDKFWKLYGYKRPEAYELLQTIMSMSPKEAHISRFNIDDCKKLLKKLEDQVNFKT